MLEVHVRLCIQCLHVSVTVAAPLVCSGVPVSNRVSTKIQQLLNTLKRPKRPPLSEFFVDDSEEIVEGEDACASVWLFHGQLGYFISYYSYLKSAIQFLGWFHSDYGYLLISPFVIFIYLLLSNGCATPCYAPKPLNQVDSL